MFGYLGNLSTVPYIDQYFGVWAMAEDRLMQTWQAICQLNIAQHLVTRGQETKQAAGESQKGLYQAYTTGNGIAVVQLSGMLMKQQSSMGDNTSSVAVRKTIRTLANDPNINAVMLVIDSPGGTASGTNDLADEIAALSKVKPTLAYCDGLTASAAYWVASQANTISAGKDAIVGSIGTYAVVTDMSEMAKNEGIKVQVIRAGDFKGAGTPGTEVTADQLNEMQRTVNALNQHFLDGVALGRKMNMDQVKAIADGRVHIGTEAQKIGLIDHVENFDAAVARLESMITKQKGAGIGSRKTSETIKPGMVIGGSKGEQISQHNDENDAAGSSGSNSTTKAAESGPQKGSTMSQENPGSAPSQAGGTSKAATISELKAAFPNDMGHVVSCAEKGMSLLEAQAAYATVLATQNAQLQAQLAEANKKPAAVEPAKTSTKPGVAPLASGKSAPASDIENPVEAFNAAIVEQMKVPGYSNRTTAIKAVCRRDPQLHQAYLLATNPPKVHNRIAEHFSN